MENKENLVAEQVAENAEIPAEETPKTYTEAEFNAKLDEVLGKKIARREAKIRKEYDRQYGRLVDTLRAGTGKESVNELTETLTKFYEDKGIRVNRPPEYSDRDIEILSRAEADDIIRSGDDEVIEEVDRLSELGVDNMTARDRAVFKILAERRESIENRKELSKIGVGEDVYNSSEFAEFRSKFNSKVPIRDIYDIYTKTQSKKEFKTMGSMKNNTSDDSAVKDFYTYEEAMRFSKQDLDRNPALMSAIERSMSKW